MIYLIYKQNYSKMVLRYKSSSSNLEVGSFRVEDWRSSPGEKRKEGCRTCRQYNFEPSFPFIV